MFYLIRFKEKYNQYIEHNKYKSRKSQKKIYLSYLYNNGNSEEYCVGIMLENVNNNGSITESDVIRFVENKIIELLNNVFTCKNINSYYGLTHPNSNLFDKINGKIDIYQLIFALRKQSIYNRFLNYMYNMLNNKIFQLKELIFGNDGELLDRFLEIDIAYIDKVYRLTIFSNYHLKTMLNRRVINKLYTVYHN